VSAVEISRGSCNSRKADAVVVCVTSHERSIGALARLIEEPDGAA
jgi:hypothetical protein